MKTIIIFSYLLSELLSERYKMSNQIFITLFPLICTASKKKNVHLQNGDKWLTNLANQIIKQLLQRQILERINGISAM